MAQPGNLLPEGARVLEKTARILDRSGESRDGEVLEQLVSGIRLECKISLVWCRIRFDSLSGRDIEAYAGDRMDYLFERGSFLLETLVEETVTAGLLVPPGESFYLRFFRFHPEPGGLVELVLCEEGIPQEEPMDSPLHDVFQEVVRAIGHFFERRLMNEREREHFLEYERITRLYEALLAEEDLLFHGRSDRELLHKTCRKLVKSGLFIAAWIGAPDSDGVFQVKANAGQGTEEISSLQISLSKNTAPPVVRCWRTGSIQISNDHRSDPLTFPWVEFLQKYKWRATAAVPIRKGGQKFAVLSVVSDQEGVFDRRTMDLISMVGKILGRGLEDLSTRQRLREEELKQHILARTDNLTGLLNRRALYEQLPGTLNRATRSGRPVCVGILDLDDFKGVNDRFGHSAGDQVLTELGKRLRNALRKTDSVARVGGDEFVLVMEEIARAEDIPPVIDRLMEQLARPYPLSDTVVVPLSLSLGLALFPEAPTLEILLARADEAMYALKQQKKARVRWRMWSQDPDQPAHSADLG